MTSVRTWVLASVLGDESAETVATGQNYDHIVIDIEIQSFVDDIKENHVNCHQEVRRQSDWHNSRETMTEIKYHNLAKQITTNKIKSDDKHEEFTQTGLKNIEKNTNRDELEEIFSKHSECAHGH